jgi:uncharacterized protein involved in outer membrane biogenesis
MIKKIGLGIAGIFLLVLILLIAVLSSLGSFITPQFLVNQIESSLNVRANVKAVDINLLSALSSIKLEGVELGRRDQSADQGTPLAERTPMSGSTISLGEVRLGLSLGALLQKKFQLDEILVVNPEIRLTLFENGSNNLSPLFQPPAIVNGKPNPALSPEVQAERKKLEEEARSAKNADSEPKEPFRITSLPVELALGRAGIENGNIQIQMKKTGQLIQLRNTNLILRDLNINPRDLKNQNELFLDFSFGLTVLDSKREESAKFLLQSAGKITPFDAQSGEVNPNVTYNLKIGKGSFLNGFAAFDALAGSLPALRQINLKLDKLAQRAELSKDVQARIGYTQGRVRFLDSPNFPTKNYDLKIEEGTWIQITNSTHQMRGSILATEADSKKALDDLDKTLQANAKGADTTEIKKRLLGNLVQNNRIALPFQSTGNIKSPVVTLGIQIPSLGDLFKGAAKQAVKDAIQSKVPGEAKDALKKFGF